MRVWTRHPEWRCTEVRSGVALGVDADGTIEVADKVVDRLAEIVPFAESGGHGAALVTHDQAAIRLNGCAPLGLVVLDDRDEILVAGRLAYFGAYAPTAPHAFPGTVSETRCARCKTRLHRGDIVQQCASCGAFHHAGRLANTPAKVRECLQYDPRCGACGRCSDAMLWTPEDFDD